MYYEKKYKEALAKCKAYIDDTQKRWSEEFCKATEEVFFEIFPELAESKDERIRKNLLGYIKGVNEREVCKETLNEWIAWLEKQDENSPVLSNSLNIGKENDGKISPKWTEEDSLMIDSIIDTMKWLEGKGATDMKIDWLEQLKQRLGYQPMIPIVQKDVDALVYNFKWSKESFKDKRVTDIYRQGIYDVVELLKQRMQ